MNNMNNYDYLFKILLIGDSGVGKSSILTCFVDNVFNRSHISTIGVDFKITTITLDDKIIKLQIWDTAGQERFRNITTSYYRGAQGIIVVYDITSRESYDNVKMWLSQIDRYCKDYPYIILIGNKSDIPDKRAVEYNEALKFAEDNDMILIETSAKNNLNINKIFTMVSIGIKDDDEIDNDNMSKSVILNNPNHKIKSWCCS
jgi:Ras-related protein Rab-1A